MKIKLIMLAWNEEFLLPFVLKHYKEYVGVSEITIYDNHSTDNTKQIAESFGATVIPFGTPDTLDDRFYLQIKNNFWKGTDADWVIVCDADEVLYHKDIKGMLERAKQDGKTIFKTRGFDIYSNDTPLDNLLEIQSGVESVSFSKKVIFNPQKISAINYSFGCHEATPMGKVVWANDIPTLFHYRNLGGVEKRIERHAQYAKRMSTFNRVKRLGGHYLWDAETIKKEFSTNLALAKQYESN